MARTFNGQKVRCRIYTFDGQSFRTIWAPDDLLDATLKVDGSGAGFAIDQMIPTPPYEAHSQYVLTANGPLQIS